MDFQVQASQPPVIRTVPADPAASNTNQTSKSRRRTSLPAPIQTTDARTKKQSSNYIRTQAASPQVISSLIDQLSALSIPAHNHFENLLTGYESLSIPPSPSARSYSERQSFQDAASTHSSAYYNSIRDHNDLYPDDACEPPVVRTSKPPSGKSSITAPKKRGKENALSNYIHRSNSTASLQSIRSHRSTGSIGNISIEAVPSPAPKQAQSDSTRSSGESKRSGKGHRSLMYMSSRERLRQKETERKRSTVHNLEKTPSAESQSKTTTLLFPYEDTIKEEPTTPATPALNEEQHAPANEVTRFAQRNKSRNHSPRRLRLNLVDAPPQGDSPTDKGLIPERGSSLRHSGSPSRKSRKAQAAENAREKSLPPAPVTEQDEKMDEEAKMKEKILSELEKEEDDVARRIRELREQKMRRDKLAGKMPIEDLDADAGATTPTPANGHVSPVPDPEPSPTFTVSPESEKRVQDPAKAHKVLGIAREVVPMEETADKLSAKKGSGGDLETIPISQTRSSRHSRHRSLTVNDGEDTTPLPINYALALRRLDEVAPPLSPLQESHRPNDPSPRSISTTSTKGTASSSDSIRPKRSQSMAVGGRSAIGRRVVSTSVVMGGAPGHKYSTSSTEAGSEVSAPPVRSPSEEMSNRHKSMHATSTPASNSLKLQRRRTLTKKRWSHPDLPAKAEKQHNAKVDRSEARAEAKAAAAAAAVQSPTHPVVEDRPTSADSIDLEVENYLNSPRLSQTIRHPQTGRIISFSEVGDPHGYAVFVCVGMGLTRYVMAFYDQLALTLKLRMITPDRPGIGGSQVDQNGTPLSWPDDVLVICQALKINKFSLLAHSAGAVYALATSLRMPQHIRGRVHLLAPWIPPSQMAPIGISQDSPPTQQLPRSQRFLRALPPSLLKVANSTFLSATSASLQRSGPKNSPKNRRKSIAPQPVQPHLPRPSIKDDRRQSMMMMDQMMPNASTLNLPSPGDANYEAVKRLQEALSNADLERQRAFDERLTFAIWDRATANANPATDLIVCLETKQAIGFRYEDINRPVVIHHGSKDSRVPADNVRWLGKLMRKCEVRILEGEQHGLMASAQVMGNVLTEMASDWEDWTSITNQKSPADGRTISRRRTTEKLRSQMSFTR